MSWSKIDDKLHGHPKAALAGLEAMGLWTLALSWSASYLTDGYIPYVTVNNLGGDAVIANRLVEVGLWERAEEGYQIHDYHDYNPTAEKVKATKAARAEAGRVGGGNSHAGGRPSENDYEKEQAKDEAENKQKTSKKQAENNPVPVPVPGPVPNPKKRGGGKKTPPLTPPAVNVFRSNAHRYPPKSWYADIDQIVGHDQPELDRWGCVVKAWVGQGWNPTNVDGMLDFFKNNEIPPGNGRTRQQDKASAADEWLRARQEVGLG